MENATYWDEETACKCNDQYKELRNGECILCRHYIQAYEVTGYYDESFHHIILDVKAAVRTDHFTNQSCSDFVSSATLAKLGDGPTCIWISLDPPENEVERRLTVTPGRSATIA